MKAALFVGGWEGHRPENFAIWASELLQEQGFEVNAFHSFKPLLDEDLTSELDLIIPIWSSARSSHQEEFGNINREEELALLSSIACGCGIAGWHGHMGDAFRDHPSYHFMIGGQFVAHPPGWPDNLVPSADFLDYKVELIQHPLTEGLEDFDMHGEQYYMLVDPNNEVIASSKFSGEHLPWLDGVQMPLAWTKTWAAGRVFYCSLGHTLEELQHPSVTTLLQRGFHWAKRREKLSVEQLPLALQNLFGTRVTQV